MTIEAGDKAPNFELKNQHGETIKLGDFIGKKNIVLFFYPADHTSKCTKEACSFRDNYEKFNAKDTIILGISRDGVSSHKSFSEKFNLPFHLLSDKKKEVVKLYGVPEFLFFIPGRVTFVIGKSGEIVKRYDAFFESIKHVEEALLALTEN